MVVIGGGAVSYERGTPLRQSRLDSGLGFMVKVLKPFNAVASSVGSGMRTLSSSSLLLSSLELSDTKDYEPEIQARLGTAAHCGRSELTGNGRRNSEVDSLFDSQLSLSTSTLSLSAGLLLLYFYPA